MEQRLHMPPLPQPNHPEGDAAGTSFFVMIVLATFTANLAAFLTTQARLVGPLRRLAR